MKKVFSHMEKTFLKLSLFEDYFFAGDTAMFIYIDKVHSLGNREMSMDSFSVFVMM